MSDMPSVASFAARAPLPAPIPGPRQQQLAIRRDRGALEQALRRRMVRRSACDAALILLATAGAGLLATNGHDRLLACLAVLSLGILLFVLRRGGDVAGLVAAGRWRDEAVAGRGLSLAQWHSGVPLPGWGERSAEGPGANGTRLSVENGRSGPEFPAEKSRTYAAAMPEISDSRDDAR